MSAVAIRSRDVEKSYDGVVATRALGGVSFDVAPGEMVALRGASGSGKSTLVAILACADRASAGSLELNGIRIEGLADRALRAVRRRELGVVFQEFHLLGALTVRENVALPLVLLRRPRFASRERVIQVLERVGMANLAERYPAQLSGGQAQRVAIARAIVHEPAIVLCDEPTGNLDLATGEGVVRLLRELADAGQTIVIATHDERVAAACDRSLTLHDGKFR